MKLKKTETSSYGAMDVANCTNANLRKATRTVAQVYDAALRPAGLRGSQFTLIATLASLGDPQLTRLADALGMDRTTLTRNLKPLVEKGLVRTQQGEDQRVRVISLTEEGRELLETALPCWREAQARLVDGLGQERWSALLDDLATTVSVVRKG